MTVNTKLRDELFKDLINFPKSSTDKDIISRVIGGDVYSTLPQDQGRSIVWGNTGDDELARRNLKARALAETEDKRKEIRGSIVIEEGRKKLENKKAELARYENDYNALLTRGGYTDQSPQTADYRKKINELRNEIGEKESWYAGYDSLINKIKGHETLQTQKEATEAERAFELTQEQIKKPFGETPEGMIAQGTIDAALEKAKNEGKLSPADDAEIKGLQDIIKNEKLPEKEVTAAQKRLNEIFANYRQPTETQGIQEINNLLNMVGTQTAKGKIVDTGRDNVTGQFMIRYDNRTVEPYTSTQAQQTISRPTINSLISQIPDRPDKYDIIASLKKEINSSDAPLTSDYIRELYVKAARNGDTELANIFSNMAQDIKTYEQVNPQQELKLPQGITKDQIPQDQINTIMKEKGLTEQQAVNIWLQNQNIIKKQTISTNTREENKVGENIKAKTTPTEEKKNTLPDDQRFIKNSYGDVISIKLDDGNYISSYAIERGLKTNFSSWLNKLKQEHNNLSTEDEKIIREYAYSIRGI